MTMNPSQDMNSIPSSSQDTDSILSNVAVETVQRLAASSETCRRLDIDFEKVKRSLVVSSRSKNNNNRRTGQVQTQERQHTQERIPRSPLLPMDYELSPNTVIIGRGREQKENPGNIRLRSLAMMYLEEYSKAEYDKNMKSHLVTRIVSMTNQSCPGGIGFIKRNKNGGWEQGSNSAAREKAGYTFRDLLADRYKSSSKSKVARMRALKGVEETLVSKNESDHNPLEWRHDMRIPLKSVFDTVSAATAKRMKASKNSSSSSMPIQESSLPPVIPKNALSGIMSSDNGDCRRATTFRRCSSTSPRRIDFEQMFPTHQEKLSLMLVGVPQPKRMSAPPIMVRVNNEVVAASSSMPSMLFNTDHADSPNHEEEECAKLLKTAKLKDSPMSDEAYKY